MQNSILKWSIAVYLTAGMIPCDLQAMCRTRSKFHISEHLRATADQAVWRTLAGVVYTDGTNDGPGLSARLSYSFGVAVDSAGVVYFTDSGNHTIRKITGDGIVITVAGHPGTSGYRDGVGTNALFTQPSGLAIDAGGFLYLAEGNHVIRRISPAGVVSTVAGQFGTFGFRDGVGTNALFFNPRGVAVDSTGTVYVVDSMNQAIRKISPAGVVSTMAGKPGTSGFQDGLGTNGLFSNPSGIAVDSQGFVFVADSDNAVIRRITPPGNVTTFAGQPQYVGHHDGTTTNAWFNAPLGVVVEADGTVYVADSGNRVIRQISSAGEVSTITGKDERSFYSEPDSDGPAPFARFSWMSALAADGSGHLIVASSGAIRRGSLGPESRPEILRQPRDESLPMGANVELNVLAQSARPLAYQWLFNGTPLPGQTNASLELPSITDAATGEYWVAISEDGARGVVLSRRARLSIQSGPDVPSHDPLEHWGPIAAGPVDSLTGCAYGGGVYVAVGNKGTILRSPDGRQWTWQFSDATSVLNGVAYGNDTFVVVGRDGKVLTSTTGIEWEVHRVSEEGTPELDSVAFDRGLFVAVSGDACGSIWTSSDGINWSNQALDCGLSLMAVATDGKRFVAVGNTILTSTNGVDWESAPGPSNLLGADEVLTHLTFGNGMFVASQGNRPGDNCDQVGSRVVICQDGVNWQEITPTNGLYLSGIVYGNGRFVGKDLSAGISTSTNGIDWSVPAIIQVGGQTAYGPAVFAGGVFLAGETSSTLLFTSTDAEFWTTQRPTLTYPFYPDRISFLDGNFWGISPSHGIESSIDGFNWSYLVQTNGIRDLDFAEGMLVSVGEADAILTSTDGGVRWTNRSPAFDYGGSFPVLSRVAHGNGVWVGVGSLRSANGTLSAHALASGNAIDWQIANTAGLPEIRDVAYGNGVFVGVGYEEPGTSIRSDLMISTNGLTWTRSMHVANRRLVGVKFGNGRFIAGWDSDSSYFISSDGILWTHRSKPAGSAGSLTWGNGLFVSSDLANSRDGLDWSRPRSPVYLDRLAGGDGVFLGLGADELLYRSAPLETLATPRMLTSGGLEWTVIGAAHARFRVEFTEDFLNWQTLTTVNDSATAETFIDPETVNHPRRFYRIQTDLPE